MEEDDKAQYQFAAGICDICQISAPADYRGDPAAALLVFGSAF